MGDATQIRQVIHNLLQNAQDAVTENAKPGQVPRIDVSLKLCIMSALINLNG